MADRVALAAALRTVRPLSDIPRVPQSEARLQHQLLVDHELVPARGGVVVRALLTLRGDAPAASTRLPINISLVLDRSGSMGGEKLAAAREAAAFLVRRLGAEDTVSVVAYDDRVTTVAPPAPVADVEALAEAIRAIPAGGSTNLSGGWLRGRELVAAGLEGAREGSVHRILLLTDGQANVGITDPAMLTGLCAGAREAGITTTTIGFGADYDEQLLRAMADAGGGNTYYIETPDQAPGVFEEEIEGLLSLAAQNVAVEIHGGAAEMVMVHNAYPSQPIEGGVRLELGDLYAREPRKVLLELLAPAAAVGAGAALATVTVSAAVLTAAGGVELREAVIPVSAFGAEHQEPEVRREVLLLEAARAREEALRRRQAGDVDGAAAVLRHAAMMIASAPAEVGAGLAEQAGDLTTMAMRIEQEFSREDEKYLAQRAYNVRRGKDLYEQKLARRTRPT